MLKIGDKIKALRIAKKSIDARDKSRVQYVLTFEFEIDNEDNNDNNNNDSREEER